MLYIAVKLFYMAVELTDISGARFHIAVGLFFRHGQFFVKSCPQILNGVC